MKRRDTAEMSGGENDLKQHRLIFFNNFTPDSPQECGMKRLHSVSQAKLSWKKLFFYMCAFLVLPGAIAYAGFFSFFSDIFTKVNTEEKPINSQNIALLASVGADFGTNIGEDVNTVGESALLADAGPEGGLADVSGNDFEHGQISIYVVHDGDSFTSIAKMFDVSVNTILWANNMPRGAKLTVGQTLIILPVSGVQYVVKKGDTIESIAKKYKGDPDEIRAYNALALADVLDVGAELIIPDGEMPTAAPKTVRPASSKVRNVGGPNYSGYYAAPLANYRRTQGLHGYNGIDLGSYIGAPITAAAAGDVIIARQGGYNGGYGNYVVVKHGNGTQTLYAHMLSTAVSAGQHVVQGQVVGALGNTGRSTGPHLHFEVRGARNPF
jgi:LysM repeat protein